LTKSVSTKSKTLALLTLNYIENSYYWRYHVKDNVKGVSKLYINRLTNFALQYANYAGKKDAKKVVKDYKSKLLLISAKLSDKMQIYTQGNINKLQHLAKSLNRRSLKNVVPENKNFARFLQQTKSKKMSIKQVNTKMNKLLSIVAPPPGTTPNYNAFDEPGAAKKASASKNNAAATKNANGKVEVLSKTQKKAMKNKINTVKNVEN
jgi:hypothetical protein